MTTCKICHARITGRGRCPYCKSVPPLPESHGSAAALPIDQILKNRMCYARILMAAAICDPKWLPEGWKAPNAKLSGRRDSDDGNEPKTL